MDFVEDIFNQMGKAIEENGDLKRMIENWHPFDVLFTITDPEMIFTVSIEKSKLQFIPATKLGKPTAEMITTFPVLAKLFTGAIDPHKAIFEGELVEVKGSLLAVQKLKELMELAFEKIEENKNQA